MPTPSADFQASLLGLLMGEGTDYPFGIAGIDGLGNPDAKSADVVLDGQDGSYGSPDYMGPRTILVHVEIAQDTPTQAWNLLHDLKTAWMPSTANVELHIQLPGLGHIYYDGRPRSLETDLVDFPLGHISAIGEFEALDPHQHVA